jgi:osmotically-inducible protein OsmY
MKKSLVFGLLGIAACVSSASPQTVSQRPAHPQPGRFDSAIRTQLDQLLRAHKEYSQVTADVDAGMVTLAGKVPLFRDRKTLIDSVLRMPHVETVRDQVELAEEPIADKLLMGRLAERLGDLMPEGAQYQVHEGRVRLTGKVKDQPTWSKIVSIVGSTPGVQEVEDRLIIAQHDRH